MTEHPFYREWVLPGLSGQGWPDPSLEPVNIPIGFDVAGATTAAQRRALHLAALALLVGPPAADIELSG